MRLIILVILLNIFSNCFSQVNLQKADCEKYTQASDYILGHEELWGEKPLRLADSLVYIPVSYFFDELDKVYHYHNRNLTLDSLNSLDHKRIFRPIYWNALGRKKFKNSSKYTLYFSKIYNNQLIAEVIDIGALTEASYERITILNTGIVFLFEFNSENKIKRVFTNKLNYN